ncbi:MAG TPA: GIY-YIG nuclease family protein [Marinagarivorans sp.]
MSNSTQSASNTLSSQWHIYIVRCRDNSFYTGVTTDVNRRLHEHNNCNKKGAKYTRARRPVTLVYQEHCASKKIAYQREYYIKHLPRAKKERLVSSAKSLAF